MADIALPKPDAAHEDWQVYADALQNAGDPRGEFYSLILPGRAAAGDSSAKFDAYINEHEAAIFGDFAPYRSNVAIEWNYCVPTCVNVKVKPQHKIENLFRTLLASPLGQTMHALRVIAQSPEYKRVDLSPGLRLLAEGLSSTCTDIELIDERAKNSRMMVSADYSPDTNLIDFGPLSALWAVSHLERLHLHVADTEQVRLDTIKGPAMRDFGLFGLRWGDPYGRASSMSEALAKADWPKLERLSLRIPETYTYSWPEQYNAYIPVDRYEEDNYDYDYDDGYREDMNWSTEFAGLFSSLAERTKIQHLSLTSFASSRNLLTALRDHGLPPSLRSLDLSGSDLDDADAEWIGENTDLFAQLEQLDLSGTQISSKDRLAGLDCEVLHSSGGGAQYQFSVGME